MAGREKSIWSRDLTPMLNKIGKVFAILIAILGVTEVCLYVWAVHTIDVDAAKDFMSVWMQDSSAASSKVDSRSPDAARDLVRTTKLKTFDGVISDAGEDTITLYATGVQYAVHNYRVTPVVNLAGLNIPLPMTISVATDTHQVFSAKPDALP